MWDSCLGSQEYTNLHLSFVCFLALLSLWPGPHIGVEEKSYNSWRHNLLHVNINALKSFSLAAHIWRAEENICVCVCVCTDSDGVFLTLKITGGQRLVFAIHFS